MWMSRKNPSRIFIGFLSPSACVTELGPGQKRTVPLHGPAGLSPLLYLPCSVEPFLYQRRLAQERLFLTAAPWLRKAKITHWGTLGISCTDASCLLLHRVFCHWDYANICQLHWFIWSAANTDVRVCVRECGRVHDSTVDTFASKILSWRVFLDGCFCMSQLISFDWDQSAGAASRWSQLKVVFFVLFCFRRQRPIVTDATVPFRCGSQIVSRRSGPSSCGGNVVRSCQLCCCTCARFKWPTFTKHSQ